MSSPRNRGAAQASRITLKLGKSRRSFVVVKGPTPDVGDLCTLNGQDWLTVKVERVPIVATFTTAAGKLRQVFP